MCFGNSGEFWKSFRTFRLALGVLGKLWESSGGVLGPLAKLRELWGDLGSWGVKFLKNSNCVVLTKMVNFSLCTLPENC